MIKAIYTDFFDTLMFRHVHPYQVLKRWSNLLAQKIEHPELAESFYNFRISNKEGRYNRIYDSLYSKIQQYVQLLLDKEEFIEICLNLECGVEIGCQYVNHRYLKWLEKQKANEIPIYIVSDFHLGKKELVDFLIAQGVNPSLFDDIFVSSDYDCSKSNGSLYDRVTEITGFQPKDVLMIGDNKRVDIETAKKKGFNTKYRPNFFQHLKGRLKLRFHYDYSKRAFRAIRKSSFKYGSPFSEYSLIFYVVARELYKELEKTKETHVAFLSREGHFMERAFSEFQQISVPSDKLIKTQYLKCSRRASRTIDPVEMQNLLDKRMSITEYLKSLGFGLKDVQTTIEKFSISEPQNSDELLKENKILQSLLCNSEFKDFVDEKIKRNQKAFSSYVNQFIHDNKINLVDIGWGGSMQEFICKNRPIEQQGYYLGLYNSPYSLNNRKGLLFTYCPRRNVVSPYGEILRSNTQLYELLAAAPHGSALGYDFDSDETTPIVHEEWAQNERDLYENIIKESQKSLLLLIKGISAWCNEYSYKDCIKQCALIVLKSAIISSEERLKFMKNLDKGFIMNFGKETVGIKYERNWVTIKPDIIYAPERYTRYFAKLERYIIDKSPKIAFLYKPLSWGLFEYISCLISLKSLFHKHGVSTVKKR